MRSNQDKSPITHKQINTQTISRLSSTLKKIIQLHKFRVWVKLHSCKYKQAKKKCAIRNMATILRFKHKSHIIKALQPLKMQKIMLNKYRCLIMQAILVYSKVKHYYQQYFFRRFSILAKLKVSESIFMQQTPILKLKQSDVSEFSKPDSNKSRKSKVRSLFHKRVHDDPQNTLQKPLLSENMATIAKEHQICKMLQLSPQCRQSLMKMQRFDRYVFPLNSDTILKEPVQKQMKRLQKIKNQFRDVRGQFFDNEITITCLFNHVKLVYEINRQLNQMQELKTKNQTLSKEIYQLKKMQKKQDRSKSDTHKIITTPNRTSKNVQNDTQKQELCNFINVQFSAGQYSKVRIQIDKFIKKYKNKQLQWCKNYQNLLKLVKEVQLYQQQKDKSVEQIKQIKENMQLIESHIRAQKKEELDRLKTITLRNKNTKELGTLIESISGLMYKYKNQNKSRTQSQEKSKQVQNAKKEIRQQQKKINSLQGQLQKIKRDKSETKKKSITTKQELQKVKKQSYQDTKKIAENHKNIEQLEKQINKLKTAEKQIQSGRQIHQQNNKKIQNYQSKIRTLEQDIHIFQKENQDQTKRIIQLEKTEKTESRTTKNAQKMSKELGQLRITYATLQQDNLANRRRLEEQNIKIQTLERMNRKYDEVQGQLREKKQQSIDVMKHIKRGNQAQKKLQQERTKVENMRVDLQQVRDERDRIQNQLKNLRAKSDEINTVHEVIDSFLGLPNNKESRIKYIAQIKRKNPRNKICTFLEQINHQWLQTVQKLAQNQQTTNIINQHLKLMVSTFTSQQKWWKNKNTLHIRHNMTETVVLLNKINQQLVKTYSQLDRLQTQYNMMIKNEPKLKNDQQQYSTVKQQLSQLSQLFNKLKHRIIYGENDESNMKKIINEEIQKSELKFTRNQLNAATLMLQDVIEQTNSKYTNAITHLNRQLQIEKSQNNLLRQKNTQLIKSHQSANSMLTEIQLQKTSLHRSINANQTSKEMLQRQLRQHQLKSQQLYAEINRLKQCIQKYTHDEKQLLKKLELIDKEKQQLERQNQNYKQAYDKLRVQKDNLLQNLKQSEDAIINLRQTEIDLQKQNKEHEIMIRTLKSNFIHAEQQIKIIEQKVVCLLEQKNKLQIDKVQLQRITRLQLEDIKVQLSNSKGIISLLENQNKQLSSTVQQINEQLIQSAEDRNTEKRLYVTRIDALQKQTHQYAQKLEQSRMELLNTVQILRQEKYQLKQNIEAQRQTNREKLIQVASKLQKNSTQRNTIDLKRQIQNLTVEMNESMKATDIEKRSLRQYIEKISNDYQILVISSNEQKKILREQVEKVRNEQYQINYEKIKKQREDIRQLREQLDRATQIIDHNEQNFNSLGMQYDNLQHKLKDVDNQRHQLQNKLLRMENQLIENKQIIEQIQPLEQKIREFEHKIRHNKSQDQIDTLNAESNRVINQLIQDNQQVKLENHQLQMEIVKHQKINIQFKAKLQTLNSTLNLIRVNGNENNKINESINNFQHKVIQNAELRVKITFLQHRNNELTADLQKYENNIKLLSDKIDQKTKEYIQIQKISYQNQANLRENIRQNQRNNKIFQVQIQKLKIQLKQESNRYNSLQIQLQKLKNTEKLNIQQIHELQMKIRELKVQQQMMKNMHMIQKNNLTLRLQQQVSEKEHFSSLVQQINKQKRIYEIQITNIKSSLQAAQKNVQWYEQELKRQTQIKLKRQAQTSYNRYDETIMKEKQQELYEAKMNEINLKSDIKIINAKYQNLVSKYKEECQITSSLKQEKQSLMNQMKNKEIRQSELYTHHEEIMNHVKELQHQNSQTLYSLEHLQQQLTELRSKYREKTTECNKIQQQLHKKDNELMKNQQKLYRCESSNKMKQQNGQLRSILARLDTNYLESQMQEAEVTVLLKISQQVDDLIQTNHQLDMKCKMYKNNNNYNDALHSIHSNDTQEDIYYRIEDMVASLMEFLEQRQLLGNKDNQNSQTFLTANFSGLSISTHRDKYFTYLENFFKELFQRVLMQPFEEIQIYLNIIDDIKSLVRDYCQNENQQALIALKKSLQI